MFESGPHVSCYQSFSLADGSFAGVRCVKFANFVHCPDQEGVAFVWYAEGTEPTGPYRHFGEAFVVNPGDGSRTLIAHAAGIVGNGERDEPYLRLQFEVPAQSAAVPERLLVSGDRQEEWTLVPDGVVPGYQPLQRHIERTGRHLNEYMVRKRDGTPGFGVRCTLSSGSWLGAGRWLHLTYLNLGTYIGPPHAVQFSASDIAARNYFCGLVPWGEITVRAEAEEGVSLLQVTGAWSETWQLRHSATGWRPDPRIAGLTMPG
jgi:hypothetical protein